MPTNLAYLYCFHCHITGNTDALGAEFLCPECGAPMTGLFNPHTPLHPDFKKGGGMPGGDSFWGRDE